jgi:hypothetical protein
MTGLNSIPSHSPSVVTRKTGNEYVLVPITNNIADMNSIYTLNETGAFIWEHIDGERSINGIINELMSEFEIDADTAKKDVMLFLEDLSKYLIIK